MMVFCLFEISFLYDRGDCPGTEWGGFFTRVIWSVDPLIMPFSRSNRRRYSRNLKVETVYSRSTRRKASIDWRKIPYLVSYLYKLSYLKSISRRPRRFAVKRRHTLAPSARHSQNWCWRSCLATISNSRFRLPVLYVYSIFFSSPPHVQILTVDLEVERRRIIYQH